MLVSSLDGETSIRGLDLQGRGQRQEKGWVGHGVVWTPKLKERGAWGQIGPRTQGITNIWGVFRGRGQGVSKGNQECGASQSFSLGWNVGPVCNTQFPSRRKAVKDLAGSLLDTEALDENNS